MRQSWIWRCGVVTAVGIVTPLLMAVPAAATAGKPELLPLPPPGQFVPQVTNRYLPLRPGTVWVYRGRGANAGERNVVRVLRRTKTIQGIRATVVLDRVIEDGELVERTFDWFAQDRRGRVWYLGERTRAFEDGHSSPAGSWQAGVDGARAGVVMFRRGRLGQRYWQEHLPGEAMDQGVLLDRRTRVSVRAGDYRRVRTTKDLTPLEPEVRELKFYAPRVGLVLELGVSPELGGLELVRFRAPSRLAVTGLAAAGAPPLRRNR